MCSDLVAHLKNITHNNLTNESHCVDICHEEAIEEQSFSFHETEEVESSQGNTEDICPLESDQIDQDVYQVALAESMAREILDSLLREVMLGNESKREGTILEGDCPLEELPDDVSVSHENLQPFEKIEVEGELDEVLSSKFALIQLRRGGKALLRKRRLYVEGILPG